MKTLFIQTICVSLWTQLKEGEIQHSTTNIIFVFSWITPYLFVKRSQVYPFFPLK